ncbi:PREDICTED: pentatricopeptide repeat-containing protein At1g06270 [Nelumbo nucifera]|uniref:Pentatricopeptide repeat-containing protein At1g06270 n=2 Tax=Nelumbo nucifera TaxID=4432 RepID=A0A1U8QB90_NELNU|nr:PREDICTED: pentatricopeptide repeat-containing protein At1g06270 [Nelumbo nucifera]XP_019056053.1 PREDICTED: pentatricopeptide repeat-containing protein At1g06270 [Nelumbo nucifera]XP_019056054.1 PREDICTED: pentatricopeptide repeat-containing protein At1g06270 [Nelumbo nucifera]XP_019056055.1 PREDICTED: pentatricopeptide repeat-containing protein At1g06270 [Nelumbo nucifera]XP_019056056.1 PREDICTED: pentatricopeptide repeat-containing protein At1g06270 [Nelumbo nucifera]DAD37530.1 TPA_asm: 
MATGYGAKKLCNSLLQFSYSLRHFSLFHSVSSSQTLEESIRIAINTKSYHQIPDLLLSYETTNTAINQPQFQQNSNNPFSFLSSFPQAFMNQIIDEILQSFMHLRPRSRPKIAYHYLLFHTLQCPNPLPLALAILQRTLRSGCIPAPQTQLSLSSAWLNCRRTQSVPNILSEMRLIGYHPDCNTCNFLLFSLCAIDQLAEAITVLKGMCRAGCDPDSESYGTVIGAMCEARRTEPAARLMMEMVGKIGLTPRQGTVVKVVAAMRANRELRRAVELVEFLEREGYGVGFEGYETVVEGCLERKEFVLAGKVVMEMTKRGFIPYIRVRQRVVEGLACVGEPALAYAVRQRLAELRS